ncbi:restriction endonuclease [Streptomyces halstedii]|uniref:restriction endonuclease n=1 Tax=Streptomyces halstedii TaxID=1944 RepID=UPI003D9F8AF1
MRRRRGSAVGTPDLQRVTGTARQLYGADIVLVVTNGRFSTRCQPLAAAAHAPRRPAHPRHRGQRRAPLVGAPGEDPAAPAQLTT